MTVTRVGSRYRLADAQHVAFAVPEPGAPLPRSLARIVPIDVGDAINRSQACQVVLFEDQAALPERRDRGLDAQIRRWSSGYPRTR
jgi:hypothetical protein